MKENMACSEDMLVSCAGGCLLPVLSQAAGAGPDARRPLGFCPRLGSGQTLAEEVRRPREICVQGGTSQRVLHHRNLPGRIQMRIEFEFVCCSGRHSATVRNDALEWPVS